MPDIVVKYNGNVLSPTPLVQQNYEFVDYNSRWGHVGRIELNGFLTGISGWQMAQSGIAQYFTGQFGSLEVFDGGQSIYQWQNCIVEEISFPLNHWYVTTGYKSIAPFSVKMRSIVVTSGVLEPVNEYSFVHSDDSLVTVTHKVSARGVHTTVDGFSNAVAFVKTFKGINPFYSFAPNFVPSGSGILASFSETIDRANSSYSIQEVYKYNTGLSSGYIESWTVNHTDIIDNEYIMFDVDWRIQGSPVNNGITSLENNYVNGFNPLIKIAALGYATGNMMQSAFNVTRDSGAAAININTSYVSGHTLGDVGGYFDYVVSVDLDGTLPKEDWRIDGEFVCYGPVQFKRNRIAAFKAASGASYDAWRDLLTGLIIKSPIFSYHDSTRTFGSQNDLEVSEVTGLGTLKLSLTTSDGGRPPSFWYPKYTITVEPNQWQYNLLPSANIEGQYVLQDLQTQTRAKVSITVEGETRDKELAFPALSGFVNSLSNICVSTGYITNESYYTGILDVQYQRNWLGLDNLSTGLTFTRIGGTQNISNYVRKPGYKFGY
jgi:hypothetical protein